MKKMVAVFYEVVKINYFTAFLMPF